MQLPPLMFSVHMLCDAQWPGRSLFSLEILLSRHYYQGGSGGIARRVCGAMGDRWVRGYENEKEKEEADEDEDRDGSLRCVSPEVWQYIYTLSTSTSNRTVPRTRERVVP